MKSSNPTSRMTRLSPTKRPTAGVVTARLLAVLVVAMVITSIVGFIAFDRQGGNSAMAVVSLAIGGASAILGLLLGFLKAYLSS